MAEPGPGIALLFDDGELGNQLRIALHEHGARIVHEGSVASLSRELLRELGADVVVVNLDDDDDAALDHLYDVIDGDSPRVVFNDGQASRALGGWDRARWARHLAAKVMASGEVDPPRPAMAAAIPAPMASTAIKVTVVTDGATAGAAASANEDASAAVPPPTAEADKGFGLEYFEPVAEYESTPDNVNSESLEAELEAMLASDALSNGEDDLGQGLRYFKEAPALHDGDFGEPAATDGPSGNDSVGAGMEPDENVTSPAPDFAFDHLPSDLSMTEEPAPEPPKAPAPTVVSAPDSWALLDDEAPAAAAPESGVVPPASFGIVKQSAADFLSPEVEDAAPLTEPVMSLQLLSMEEAVAPQPYEHEMQLDDLGHRLRRVVLLGAAADGMDSVCDFLSALPAGTRLTFLLTQHPGTQLLPALIETLTVCSSLPVRPVTHGGFAAPGQVLVAPLAQQVSLRRDGGMDLRDDEADAGHGPSIDANFSTIANVFGRDVVAIVFAGRSTDAVAGAQAVHDLGGRVWVETSPIEQYPDMVGGIFAERLVSYSGTPQELAAHLIEVFS